MKARMGAVWVILVSVVLVAGCASAKDASVPAADPEQAAGTLVGSPDESFQYPSVMPMVQRAMRIHYRSTDATKNQGTTVSGVVFVPKGKPPASGWPVAAIAHPATGVINSCGPSLYPDLLGVIDMVKPLVDNGYVTAVTDYQGLGAPGKHPFLESTTAAYNVIDSVKAARAVVPDTSKTWVAYGVSQGGQAAFRADEVAKRYAPDLDLRGVISESPALNLEPLVDAMERGTTTPEQIAILPSLLTGLKNVHPELNVDDYLRGTIRWAMDTMLSCSDDAVMMKGWVAQATKPNDIKPKNRSAADRLRGWLREVSLPKVQDVPASGLFVAYSSGDQVIRPEWTASALARACKAKYPVTIRIVRGQPHGILNLGKAPEDWLAARMRADAPAPLSTC